MYATQDYYENKIAILQAKLDSIRELVDFYNGLGSQVVPVELLLERVKD